MAISTTTGWIDNNAKRLFYIDGVLIKSIPTPNSSASAATLYTVMLQELNKMTWNDELFGYVEIGIMVGNQLKEVPSGL